MTTPPPTLKRVCIVGAGPSGLIAAKTLTRNHPGVFHVTIFEALDRIGGLWPLSKSDDGLVNPDMCTNQSRHTVTFAGLAWPENTPLFPKAWQVGGYLERYREMYGGYEVRLGTRVVKAEFKEGKWRVETSGKEEGKWEFEYLVVATGFFGRPRVPRIDGFEGKVVHSSQVRVVRELVDGEGTGKKIVVVGGQMSGVEIAASIAGQISSEENSPGEGFLKDAEKYVVTNVVQTPVWIMPLFLPKEPWVTTPNGEKIQNPATPFLPCDLVTYNLTFKPPGKLQNTSGHISEEAAVKTHGFLEGYIGTDQTEFGSNLSMTGDVRTAVPYLAASDTYSEFVRSGKIQTVRGKVLDGAAGKKAVTVVDESDEAAGPKSVEIDDVAAVVFATGFEASPSLDFLPKELLETLQFDPKNAAFPLALDVHSTVNWNIPSLGFVGFYRSPYWGVMEMQARYLGALWTGDPKALQALSTDTGVESILKLRNDPRRANFPMGDYAYLMESFAEILDIKRSGDKPGERTGGVFGPRYLPSTTPESEKQEADKTLAMITKSMQDCESGKYVARAAFRAMQGDWKLNRTITSRIASYPSGTLTGQAYFNPRAPTDALADLEYLYLENGEFSADNGFNFTAKRTYVHRYTETTDTLSVWFTKPDQKTVDYFFHSLQFIPPPEAKERGKAPWKANSSHLCIEDLYDVEYEFWFCGATLVMWSMEYTVRGPAKDYTIRSVYRR
ncbi:FAD/NAD(P)-binding protein [Glarea lozoyensis ATCC 20868]|uniref:FAD/NAD(P)-binding protein n=1 Tax=Glarea lozoyensis (strain ATCC 20868 / MF5171) TaxID=1116229 RepID=S3CSQ0_GLAL2|nr:FAD/NAD(P)-binding protein [Glarea lozoyensis ATCC 20868]EPE28099.1 FAD/NAD(P)-binding protein [Glarea lozoyensis ATCC 20868]